MCPQYAVSSSALPAPDAQPESTSVLSRANVEIRSTRAFGCSPRARRLGTALVVGSLLQLAAILPSFGETIAWNAAANEPEWDAINAPQGGSAVDNWYGGGIPDADDSAIFTDARLVNPLRTVDLNGDRSIRSLNLYGGTGDDAFSDYTLDTTIGANTLTVGDGSGPDGLSLDVRHGDHILNCNVLLNDTTSQNKFTSYLESGSITINGVVSGDDALILSGPATMALTNANTFSGRVEVLGSTLRVANTTGSATGTNIVTVDGGGTVEGTGRFGDPESAVVIYSEGTVSPGNPASVGTLTVQSTLVVRGTFRCELSQGSSDRLAVEGFLDIDESTLDVTELVQAKASSYTIATSTSLTGTFDNVIGLSPQYSVKYTDNAVMLVRQPIWRVTADATTADTDGSSWNKPANLQYALANAVPGDEIWVKTGLYYPDEGTGQIDNDRSSTFAVPPGVALLGGFAGNETSSAASDPFNNPTVLSGDLEKNDQTTDGVVLSAWDSTELNAYSVVTIDLPVDSAAVRLDGFIITGGRADDITLSDYPQSFGGGIYVTATDPVATPVIERCQLIGNFARWGGGILTNRSPCELIDCVFRGNEAADFGGGAFFWYDEVTATNCLFTGNRASLSTNFGGQGGGAYGNRGSTDFINCTFGGNIASAGGGAVGISSSDTTMAFANTVMWDNVANGVSSSINASISNFNKATYTHCLIQNYNPSSGTGNIDGTDADNDPLFTSLPPVINGPTSEGDLHLQFGSAAIEAGDSTLNGTATDLDGIDRVLGSTVDLGAYEYDLDTTAPVIALLGDNPLTLEYGTVFVDSGATATDDRDGDLTASISADTSAFDGGAVLGAHQVIYTVADNEGNVGQAIRTVNVIDTTPPTITAPNDQSLEATTNGGAYFTSFGFPIVNDLCDPSPSVSKDAPILFPLGETIVTWTATDASGNYSTDTQIITVVDTTAPSVTAPDDVTFEANFTNGAIEIDVGLATVEDTGDAYPTLLGDTPTVFPLGATTVTWTATDASGNSSQATQIVTIVDTTAPVLTLNGSDLVTIYVADEIYDELGAAVTDLCDPTVSVAIGGDTVDVSTPGTYVVTYDAVDASGNAATQLTRTVEVLGFYQEIYVDQASDFIVTNDVGVIGTLDAGDTVTWMPGAQNVEGLTFGADAAIGVQEALDRVQAGASIFIGDGTWDEGQQIVVERAVAVYGNGAGNTILSGGESHRVINVPTGDFDVTIDGLTLTQGQTGSSSNGGGIQWNSGGRLTIRRCEIRDCAAGPLGGGISTSTGELHLVSSTVAGNTSNTNGGGIASFSYVEIDNCTISGNEASSAAGGIFSANSQAESSLVIYNSTITGNRTSSVGSGILRAGGGHLSIANTLVAGNRGSVGGDIFGTIVSLGGNFIGDPSGSTGFDASIGDLSYDSTGASLAEVLDSTLADNGGPTRTHALVAGSPAINGGIDAVVALDETDLDGDGDDSEALPYDQRGEPRFNGTVDIGAYESDLIDADVTAPVITLLGEASVVLDYGETWIDPGAEAIDDEDGSVSVSVGGDAIVSTVPGVFEITYDASDEAGNAAEQVTRTVTVRTAYDTWSLLQGLTPDIDDDPAADPNFDGVTNSEHFAFASNPLGSGGDEGKVVYQIADDGGEDYFTVTVPVRIGATFSGDPMLRAFFPSGMYQVSGDEDLDGADLQVVERSPLTDGLPELGDYDGIAGPDWEYRSFRLSVPVSSQLNGFITVTFLPVP